MTQKKIPITIITWFLGSWKTTLLNHILKNKKWLKIAIIENEYGEESIDSDILEKKFEELIEIRDGCMCCSVRWDLIKAVEALLNSGKHIDHLIIEASGMSEPLPIAQTFIMEDFWGRTRLDAIVCIVDAENFHNSIVQSLHTTSEQIESAHFIILNKTENIEESKIEEIKIAVRKLNPYSAIIESNYSQVDLASILDTDLFQEDSFSHKNSHHHWHEHDKKEIEKYFFKTSDPCESIDNIKQFLSEISESVYRIKWFLHFKWYPEHRYILQKAGSCFTLSIDENWDQKNMESRIVFIGKNLNPELLQDKLLQNIF